MAKIGDTVRFLSSTGGGRIVKIDGNIAHVEDEDGFSVPVLLKELVVVSAAGDEGVRRDISAAQVSRASNRRRSGRASSCRP